MANKYIYMTNKNIHQTNNTKKTETQIMITIEAFISYETQSVSRNNIIIYFLIIVQIHFEYKRI